MPSGAAPMTVPTTAASACGSAMRMRALNAARPVAASRARMPSSRRVGTTRGPRTSAKRIAAATAYRTACPVMCGKSTINWLRETALPTIAIPKTQSRAPSRMYPTLGPLWPHQQGHHNAI
ncbi:hypothetical protein Pa4123_36770 [Phytohabitans aurantiacus]|uniref:Uncharacterized protein n=1 Tax=Phytohabitans aurantiacus TaxID=3016789 RepID=A0ABQ5QVW0_9ACTN|nr:hypothetical protein Pa4123_36770 [Phytohabitans aurantiacus]